MAKQRRRRSERLGQYETPLYRELVTRFTTNLRQLPEARGWTQEQAGDRCGMVMQQFQRIESGKMNLTFTTLARVADGFAVDPTVLLAVLKNEASPKTTPDPPATPPSEPSAPAASASS